MSAIRRRGTCPARRQSQASRPGRLDQALAVLERNGEGLLVIDTLAGIERRLGNRGVGIRRRQIEDDLDRRVGEQFGDGGTAGTPYSAARSAARSGAISAQATILNSGKWAAFRR